VPAGFFYTLPVFGAMFLGGTTADGEPMLMFSAENPDTIQGFDGEVDKARLERFHLECYRADHVLQFGDSPFEEVAAGDRPDFTVTARGQPVSLDCAALADHHRRRAFRLMDHLRERLIAGGGGRDFSGVAGCLLSVWFGEKLDALPPKRWDDSIIDPLLDAIAECKVDHAAIARLIQEVADRGFPQVLPPVIETGKTPDESAGFVANAVLGPTEGARFSTGLGFEVQLHLPEQVTYGSAKANLDRIVSRHDQPQIEHLLLTAGGPDRTGMRFPGEEVIAGFLAQQPGLHVEVEHLQRVTLHLWSARRIVNVPARPKEGDDTKRADEAS
jgi:hypothetical protein